MFGTGVTKSVVREGDPRYIGPLVGRNLVAHAEIERYVALQVSANSLPASFACMCIGQNLTGSLYGAANERTKFHGTMLIAKQRDQVTVTFSHPSIVTTDGINFHTYRVVTRDFFFFFLFISTLLISYPSHRPLSSNTLPIGECRPICFATFRNLIR